MKTIKFIMLLAIFSIVLACEKENITHEQVDVPLGQELSIELESNWPTGYHWNWVNEDEVSVIDSTGITYQSESALLGTPGLERWKFKAILKGEEILKFEYQPAQGTDTLAPVTEEILINVY